MSKIIHKLVELNWYFKLKGGRLEFVLDNDIIYLFNDMDNQLQIYTLSKRPWTYQELSDRLDVKIIKEGLQ